MIVQNGVTLTIEAGATLTFKNNSSLIVNGSLAVNGTENNKITFNFINPNSTAQNGIRIYATATGNISNAIIKNAYYGIYAGAVNITITNCEINNCGKGIYLYSTNNLPGTTSIINNKIYSNSTGIYLYRSSPNIRDNEIYSNYYGIYANTNSSPKMGGYSQYGNNYIHNNFYGIYASQSSNILLPTAL